LVDTISVCLFALFACGLFMNLFFNQNQHYDYSIPNQPNRQGKANKIYAKAIEFKEEEKPPRNGSPFSPR
jgi:hypothetical protein